MSDNHVTDNTEQPGSEPQRDSWHSEKRRAPRVAFYLDAELGVLVPEQTSLLHSVPATISNMSTTGLMLRTLLSHHIYAAMLKVPRYCRVNLSEPDLPIQLFGKAVWIQPESDTAKTSFWCSLGLYFEGIEPEAREQLDRHIRRAIMDGNKPTEDLAG